MKKKIVLISCVSKKETEACKAKDMYLSPLFKMSWEYAKQFSPDKVFILSAKHHLLDPEQRIDPYNVTLYTFAAAERKHGHRECLATWKPQGWTWSMTSSFSSQGRNITSTSLERVVFVISLYRCMDTEG